MNFTDVFLAAILISLGTRLYLAFRQVKHIQHHQHEVPQAFDEHITLTPDPLHSAFYDSHPPASIRIAHLKQVEARA